MENSMYPSLSELLPIERVPNELEAIKDALASVLDSIFVKNLIVGKSYEGDAGYYTLDLVTDSLGIDLPIGEDFRLVFNPTEEGTTEIPIQFDYSWLIIKYIKDFSTSSFDNAVESVFNILLDLANVDSKRILKDAILAFYPEGDVLDSFITDFNSRYNKNLTASTSDNLSDLEKIELLSDDIYDLDLDVTRVVFESFIDVSANEGLQKLEELFVGYFEDIQETIKEVIQLKFNLSIDSISLGLQFPHKWIRPVDEATLELLPEDRFSVLSFNVGRFVYSSKDGFDFINAESFSLNTSMIGKTGLIIGFSELKVDLQRTGNIPEADADGRPASFTGVYAREATITLPSKWFKEVDNTTLRIAGNNMLIGTGGVSGTISLQVIDGNPNNGLDYLETDLGGWSVGFNYFDIEFKQNVIVASNIAGKLVIPKLKDSEGNKADVEISGHFNEVGDFNLTAYERDGFKPFNLFNFVNFNLLSVELGREDGKFYIGTSCEIWFDNPIMQRLFDNRRITIPRLRLYEDGSMELVGGNGFIPVSIPLNLGPVDITITGIHLGSTQQEFNGQMRKYNYWGFDGAISVDPSWLDARGEGIKYYYTVDNDEFGDDGDSFLHIQTIEVDMMIPGDANPDSAFAIIKGMVSIPEPGESPEYVGEVGLKLPKLNIAGGARLRLQPREGAFLLEAEVEPPSPIQLIGSGLAFYSFGGLLGYKYVAEKEAIPGFTSENTWYEYYKHPNLGVNWDKFSGPPKTNDYSVPVALGAGTVLATSFDDGYVFSTRLMAILSLPSVFILDGRANILGDRLGILDTSEPPFFAFVAVGDGSFEFAIGADYSLPKDNGWIIDLYAEIQAGFFANNPSGWYLNFGTRDKPIQASILHNIFSVRAYLMISARGIEMGARADFDLKGSFIGIRFHVYAYVAVGAYISFERVQLGGYVAIGGGIHVDIWRIFSVNIKLDVIAGAEAAKPFLLYFEFRLNVCIRLFWFLKICVRVTVPLKWEFNKEVDRTPIPALPNHESTYTDRTLDSVKGVHMLTGETFDLKYTRTKPSVSTIDTIIPLDTFIDIKTMKGLSPVEVRDKIGGHTGGAANFIDLVPPRKVVAGGRQVRQVKHKYSIEEIGIKMWNGSAWVAYHPFEAVVPVEDRESVKNFPIGYWQRTGKQYDAIRILGTSPFSYMTAGEPGWFIPEQYGITPSELFCVSEVLDHDCINFLNKQIGTRYYRPNGSFGNNINGAYFTLDGVDLNSTYVTSNFDPITGQTSPITESRNFLEVTDKINYHGKEKSLQFPNTESLVVILPEPAKEVKLHLTTFAEGVTITYYKTDETSSILRQEYAIIESVYKTKEETKAEIIYESQNGPIAKVIITPKTPVTDRAIEIREEMATLLDAGYQDTIGEAEKVPPSDQEKYDALVAELNALVAQGCTTSETYVPAPYFMNAYDYNKKLFSKGYYRDAVQINQETYAVGGFKRISNSHKSEGIITKINYKGDVLWEKVYKSDGSELSFSQVIAHENSDILVWAEDLKLRGDQFILRIDSDGNVIWCKKIKSAEKLYGTSLLTKITDNKYAIRSVSSTLVKDYIVVFDGDGNILKQKEISRVREYNTILVCVGHFIVCLTKNSIILLDQNLNYLNRIYAFIEGFEFYTVNSSNISGNELVLGVIWRKGEQTKYYIFKLDLTTLNETTISVQLKTLPSVPNFTTKGDKIYHYNFDYSSRISQVNCLSKDLDVIYSKKVKNANIKVADIKQDKVILTAYDTKYFMAASLDGELNSCNTEPLSNIAITEEQLDLQRDVTQTIGIKASSNIYFEHVAMESVDIKSSTRKLCTFKPILDNTIKICHTSLQKICWLTQEKWEYNQTIPGLDAMEEEQLNMEASVEAEVQPVWRPNTSYYVHFQLKDEVDNGSAMKTFDYYYSFKTAGPVGHFHNAPGVTYGNEYDNNTIINRIDANGNLSENGKLTNPDNYLITALRQYIDYNKSYPNANGNLLQAKPLFYGAHQAKLSLFFSAPFVKHMLSNWEAYNNMDALSGNIHLAIKDPVTNTIIPYPLPQDFSEETVPITETFATWVMFTSDTPITNKPNKISLFDAEGEALGEFNILKWEASLQDESYHVRIDDQAVLAENPDIEIHKLQWENVEDIANPFEFTVESYGKEDATWNDNNDPTIPLSIRTINNWIDFINENFEAIQCELKIGDPLKPKSYTYSVSLTNLKPRKLYTALVYNAFEVNSNNVLVSERIHEYVFQTSRYKNFEEQVKSYQLTDEEGNRNDAIFRLELPLSSEEVTTLMHMVSTENTDEQNFDKLIENILGMNPLDPPVSTEFNSIKNGNTEDIVAVLIRNPEPFNNPKIPIEIAKDMIRITNDINGYHIMYAKDYASAIITHKSGKITEESLNFMFTYYVWNGKEYVTQEEVIVANILIKKN